MPAGRLRNGKAARTLWTAGGARPLDFRRSRRAGRRLSDFAHDAHQRLEHRADRKVEKPRSGKEDDESEHQANPRVAEQELFAHDDKDQQRGRRPDIEIRYRYDEPGGTWEKRPQPCEELGQDRRSPPENVTPPADVMGTEEGRPPGQSTCDAVVHTHLLWRLVQPSFSHRKRQLRSLRGGGTHILTPAMSYQIADDASPIAPTRRPAPSSSSWIDPSGSNPP